ncbi:SRPBCC family protein [Cellulomonas phragmiteti]|uniref:Polyketide cyclase n=1 Tax=Cellulomonas phragmiteti TaxID=478780 RepID=A0ABQ4DR79_9CELL|nr:SRPBCC family protein [Cellulomonas phragmiteti]GIG41855.1 polyketide cyclase [Cellulomonas phragmiteti]
MSTDSLHLGVRITRPVADVYAFVSDPANLPRWAPGLGTQVEEVDGQWFVLTPQGRARVTFAPRNDLGVLDHEVVTPAGLVVHVPVRAIADGPDACDVVFTLRRAPGMTDAELARDEGLVRADLARLRDVLEGA